MTYIVAGLCIFLIMNDLNNTEREKQFRSRMIENQNHFVGKHFDKYQMILKKYQIL